MDITVLGSGTSKGIPEIGCNCRVCNSTDPHDRRLRCSVLLETMGQKILIDASPDFREQALRNDIQSIDALVLTHVHYDHVGGIDDLRPFCLNLDIPVYCRKDVEEDLKRRIDYCFRDHRYPGVPAFETKIIDNAPFFVNGVRFIPVSVNHGRLPIVGYRIGNFAYITDCKEISDVEKGKLQDLDVLIVNALRDRDHFAHHTIEEAVKLIEELKPKRAFLTHLCHEAGTDAELRARLPEGILPAYDGQKIRIQ
ncbi:MAG: MBL fold metallo-hydrolase [Muribaculaceae bacterium]|nr:MBL fold metallo-hydrolase [Muribaculaceae bacterium]